MKTVDLGDGKTAVVREYHELTRGDVRKIFKAVDAADIKAGTHEGGAALIDAAMMVMVDSWDLDVPVSFDTVTNLPLTTYDALDDAVGTDARKVLGINEAPDPKSDSPSSPSDSTESSQPEA